jgi:hypothetical protein
MVIPTGYSFNLDGTCIIRTANKLPFLGRDHLDLP